MEDKKWNSNNVTAHLYYPLSIFSNKKTARLGAVQFVFKLVTVK
jgi:hypothetical protein